MISDRKFKMGKKAFCRTIHVYFNNLQHVFIFFYIRKVYQESFSKIALFNLTEFKIFRKKSYTIHLFRQILQTQFLNEKIVCFKITINFEHFFD